MPWTIPDQAFYENYSCGSERNYTDYCNKDLEKLFDQQSMETDKAKRQKLVWEIDKQLQEDVARPVIFHARRRHLLAALCQRRDRHGQQHLQRLSLRGRVAGQVDLGGRIGAGRISSRDGDRSDGDLSRAALAVDAADPVRDFGHHLHLAAHRPGQRRRHPVQCRRLCRPGRQGEDRGRSRPGQAHTDAIRGLDRRSRARRSRLFLRFREAGAGRDPAAHSDHRAPRRPGAGVLDPVRRAARRASAR